MDKNINKTPKDFIVKKIYEPDQERMKKALKVVMKYDPKQFDETDRRNPNVVNLNKTKNY